VGFQLLALRAIREGGKQKRLGADLLFGGEAMPRHVEVSGPAVLGSTSVLILGMGPAPLFTCGGPGDSSDGAWVKLKLDGDRITRFTLPGCGLELLARPAEDGSRSDRTGGSVMLGTRVEDGGDSLAAGVELAVRAAGGPVERGALAPGGELALAGARWVAMPEVRRYGTFEVVDEHGVGLLWAGFALGILGLVFRLLLFRREVVVVAAGPALLVAAAAEGAGLGGQEALLAELDRLVPDSGAITGGADVSG
jgi:hypothetical protein